MNLYTALKEKHQAEVNAFPMQFAFNQKQLEEGLIKLGLKPTENYKVCQLPGTGGFYRRTDAKALHEMFDRHTAEMQEAVDQDITGDGFIFAMFNYELANHEYNYTGDITDTIEALGLTYEEIQKSSSLLHGLDRACKYQMERECF